MGKKRHTAQSISFLTKKFFVFDALVLGKVFLNY